ncbi:hypothetical protein F5Y16DRAFT_400976 [Xylariaceae sp. FL0255]|nr:hypothetical protein F5Y16DRAFT_400976 [Xylariaceae sp. FL0255]
MGRTRKPPPLRLPQRAGDLEPDEQSQRLRRENDHLRRSLARLREEQDKTARVIAELTLQNDQYRAQSDSQKQLIVRIANTIGDAFHHYQDSLHPPPPSSATRRRSAATSIGRGNFEYEDALTTWSHSESSS